jgi:hypothetical protein
MPLKRAVFSARNAVIFPANISRIVSATSLRASGLKDYSETLWSDSGLHHTEDLASAVLAFLQQMDEEGTPPTVSMPGAGEVAGVT